MDKSKGHVMFLNDYEYLKGPDGTLYQVPIRNYIGVDGYRVGARFKSTASSADHCIKFLKNVLGQT